MSELIINPPKRTKAPPVPAELEEQMERILREQYLENNLTLPELQQYIQQNYGVKVTKRQLTARIKAYGLLKSRVRDPVQDTDLADLDSADLVLMAVKHGEAGSVQPPKELCASAVASRAIHSDLFTETASSVADVGFLPSRIIIDSQATNMTRCVEPSKLLKKSITARFLPSTSLHRISHCWDPITGKTTDHSFVADSMLGSSLPSAANSFLSFKCAGFSLSNRPSLKSTTSSYLYQFSPNEFTDELLGPLNRVSKGIDAQSIVPAEHNDLCEQQTTTDDEDAMSIDYWSQ